MKREALRTQVVRSALESDTHHHAVVPPLHLSSNYAFAGIDRPHRYDYTRSGNPTRDQLLAALCDLEGAAGGVVTASGMAAITVVLQLLRPGARVVAAHDCYGGTHRLLTALARREQITVDWEDLTDPSVVERLGRETFDLLWIETPSNPLLRITDVRRASAAARNAGALSVVDNTFLSPALQRPLALGVDVVVHSTTKYLNGHSDVVGGAALARDAEVAERLGWWGNCLGLTGAPFDGYLTLRGVRTLFARMRCHEENAQLIAERLATRAVAGEDVLGVYYPGLSSHPGHRVAASQQDGFGGMVSFEIAGGRDAVSKLVGELRHFSLAESLGGVESLVAHPATMTHAAMDAEARSVAGIGDGLLRLSVGIEDPRDLWRDIESALDAVRAASSRSCVTVD